MVRNMEHAVKTEFASNDFLAYLTNHYTLQITLKIQSKAFIWHKVPSED